MLAQQENVSNRPPDGGWLWYHMGDAADRTYSAARLAEEEAAIRGDKLGDTAERVH